jgi:CRISPR system Cascade subunit CasA
VWRGISSLLALEEQDSRAGVLSFLARLEVRGISMVSLLVTSAELGQMSTTLKDLLSDRLETPVAVLRATDPEAATVAAEAVVLAAAAARALGRVAEVPYLSYDEEARRHQVPEGRSKQASSAREALAEELYGALDAPYRRFLVGLGEVADRDEVRETWAKTVTKTAHDLAAREMAQLSPAQAFAGAMAESAFRQALKKARNDFSPAEERKEGAA